MAAPIDVGRGDGKAMDLVERIARTEIGEGQVVPIDASIGPVIIPVDHDAGRQGGVEAKRLARPVGEDVRTDDEPGD
jgi:hypothetical protein